MRTSSAKMILAAALTGALNFCQLNCFVNASAPAADQGFRSQASAAVAYSSDNRYLIEGSAIGDCLWLRRKDGKSEELNITSLNRAAKDKSRYTWNLYLFYIVKDAWRGLLHQNAYEPKYGREKQIGQANVTLLVHADNSYEIVRKVIYVAGCAPCSGNKMPPAVQKFWRQARAAIEYIEFRGMKIPDPNIESVTLELIIGRDLEKFPRYPAGNLKGSLLLRDLKSGKITQTHASAD